MHNSCFEEPNQRHFKQILPTEEQRVKAGMQLCVRNQICLIDVQIKAFYRKTIAAIKKKHETVSDTKCIKFGIYFW